MSLYASTTPCQSCASPSSRFLLGLNARVSNNVELARLILGTDSIKKKMNACGYGSVFWLAGSLSNVALASSVSEKKRPDLLFDDFGVRSFFAEFGSN